MDSKYSGFFEANPTFQERMEAFTSGLLTPDPKLVSLWSMEEGVSYTAGELYHQVKEFVGDRLPICRPAMWSYYRGTSRCPGPLKKFGFVANELDEAIPGPVTFEKTPVAADFGDALAARALCLSGKLTSKYRSMLKIFGGPQKKEDATARRGFVVYKVVKLLAEQPENVFRTTDVADLTGISATILTLALNTIAEAGTIDYESPYRDKDGHTPKGWAQYRLVNKGLLTRDLDELYDEYRQDRPFSHLKAPLKSVLEYIRRHPEAVYSIATLPEVVSVDRSYVSNILSFLKNRGFLESGFQGGFVHSKTRANENTCLLWEHLLRPMEAVANRLVPADCKGFYDVLDFYASQPETRKDHLQQMLARYQVERTQRGFDEARDVDAVLLALPQKAMKLSTIAEKVNATRESSLSSASVRSYLSGLVRAGRFEKPEKGYYRRL